MTQILKPVCLKGGKQCGKRRKFGLLTFFPCLTMFSKAFFFKVVINWDRVKRIKLLSKNLSCISSA